jgi:hypothetical protein
MALAHFVCHDEQSQKEVSFLFGLFGFASFSFGDRRL